MYGLLKEIKKQSNGCIKYKVIGNDGMNHTFFYQPDWSIAHIEQLKINERVEFDVRNGNSISHLRSAYKKNVKGRVIRIFYDNSGLVETDRGEILKFSSDDNSLLSPYQTVWVKPVSPEKDSDSNYGFCTNIRTEKIKELTEELKQEVAAILRKEFATETDIPISKIQDFLKKSGFLIEEYGYYDSVMFLEQFTNVLFLNPINKTARVLREEELSQNYTEAVRLLQRQGYHEPTLLQKRVFSDQKFWDSNRVLIMGSTSSGKTAIPLTNYLMDYENRTKKPKLLIAVNLRTLTTQMQETIQSRLQGNYNLNMQISTSEYIDGDNDIKNGDVDIAVVIYEKLFIFASTVNGFFGKYDHLLLDESAIVADNERGAKVDVILSKANEEAKLKITMLGTPYYNWEKYVNRFGFYSIGIFSRPVPVHEFFYYPVMMGKDPGKQNKRYLCSDCCGKNIPTGTCAQNWENTVKSLCYNEFVAEHKTLVFVFSQAETRKLSKKIYSFIKQKQNLPTPPENTLYEFIKGFLKHYSLSFEELKGYFDTNDEYEALYYGVTFHNASVPEKMRIAVETEFLGEPQFIKGGIKIVVSTDTLAYGLNSNVDTVIITQMQRYSLDQYQKLPYNTYQNCIGRSGRLGYRKFGTSYAFISDDFEKKYFDQISYSQDVPQKAIDYYTKGSFRKQEYICGTLGRILSDADSDILAFYILSLFPINDFLSFENLIAQLDRIPKTSGYDWQRTDDAIKEALTMLRNENLISHSKDISTFDEFSVRDHDSYYLTSKGRCFQGYAIRMKSYRKLYDMIDTLIVDDQIYPIDFFLALSKINEFSDSWKNFLITYQKGEEYRKSELRRNNEINPDSPTIAEKCITAAAALIDYILPEFREKRWISDKLFHEILCSSEYLNAKSGKHLNETEFRRLTALKASMVTGMWISGYSVQLLREIQGFEETGIDNIRRKLGEKISYYVDIMYAIAQNQRRSSEQLTRIHQLSVCLFYGIKFDWIIKRNIQNLSVELANCYHLASICATRMKYHQKYGTKEQIAVLKSESEILDPSIKRIMKEEGVIIDE